VIIKQRVYLLLVVQKIPLILEVDPVRRVQDKENQEADRSPSQRRKSSVIIEKNMGIINPSV